MDQDHSRYPARSARYELPDHGSNLGIHRTAYHEVAPQEERPNTRKRTKPTGYNEYPGSEHGGDQEVKPRPSASTKSQAGSTEHKRQRANRPKPLSESGDTSYDTDTPNSSTRGGRSSGRDRRRATGRGLKGMTPGKEERGAKSRAVLHPEKASKTFYRKQGVDIRRELKNEQQARKDEALQRMEVEKRNNELQEQLKQIQEEVRSSAKSRSHAGMDATDMRAEVDRVTSMWPEWARKWVVPGIMAESLQDKAIRKVVQCLQKNDIEGCRIISAEGAAQIPWVVDGSRLVLETLLSHCVGKKVFEKPFFFLDGFKTSESYLSLDVSLNATYELMQQGDQAQAKLWRTQTLKALNPGITNEESDEEIRATDVFAEAKQKYFSKSAEAFLSGDVIQLLKVISSEEQKERDEELRDIFREAGEIAIRLWLQGLEIVLWGCHAVDFDRLFHRRAEYFNAHTNMRVKPRDTLWEGILIQLFVRPAILMSFIKKIKNVRKPLVCPPALVWINPDLDWESRKQAFTIKREALLSAEQATRPESTQSQAKEQPLQQLPETATLPEVWAAQAKPVAETIAVDFDAGEGDTESPNRVAKDSFREVVTPPLNPPDDLMSLIPEGVSKKHERTPFAEERVNSSSKHRRKNIPRTYGAIRLEKAAARERTAQSTGAIVDLTTDEKVGVEGKLDNHRESTSISEETMTDGKQWETARKPQRQGKMQQFIGVDLPL